ncbi:MAG: TetR/AcrR family transcriptional regulator, partial [Solirubrobacteraceae bacterium]|nr:TetR/AcrR family transcriptional regulator [Solirubrobacteraceae bacterium]
HLAENRALKQIISGELRTTERQNRMRAELYPVMAQLVARAQASGDLRPDFVTTDVPLLNVALAASLQASEPVVPGYWRRQLAFVLDGLRTRRDGPSPLPVPGLDRDQTETIMTAPNALRP